ncbi:DHH family phosphoesterase [Metabacillus arenae]|uniref:Bifunctional oligoribonuclease/PAP phosphatase NrnA n=1 Tax=Metabacillus arenae TaxID=2771434 RepID=A0A926NLP5_9BACI|nr:bifunctional oligoribonuclease/PAP phosphatase NrnA [Metabacillus arenae]MBD1380106.1 bifunctional oligoribonuclease/PAP phosphatase NrnA [Metabacillus arenae]
MKELILEEIIKYETIILHRHVRPDPDAYGSQCGLAEMLKNSFPSKKILVTGASEPSLEFLYELDKVTDDHYQGALVIVCDTANQERICDKRYNTGSKLIKIDHHPNEDQYGDLLWVDTTASSVSEMIYEFYLFGKDKGLKLNDRAAQLIFAGIVGDTGRFLFSNTTKKTFKYASELIQYNFDPTELYNELYKTSVNVAKLSGYMMENFQLSPSGSASMVITKDILDKFEATPSHASQLVGILGNIEGLKAWVLFVQEEDQIRVRLRSKGIVINQLAKKYNGGGHPLAAGASVKSLEEVEQILSDLEKLCQDV